MPDKKCEHGITLGFSCQTCYDENTYHLTNREQVKKFNRKYKRGREWFEHKDFELE